MKEYLHIKDIQVEIKEGILKVNFVCDNKINKKVVEEFYFTKKVFKSIDIFAKKMDLKPCILFNNKKWQI